MRILVLNNLYAPHILEPDHLRVATICDALEQRGHEIHVLTSHHGIYKTYSDGKVDRMLRLNGVFDHPPIKKAGELKPLEEANNQALNNAIEQFQPEIIYIGSLQGIGKSLMLHVINTGLPHVFDVADTWIADELCSDPWLVYWNGKEVPFAQKLTRSGSALFGKRKKADELTPTGIYENGKRVKGLFDSGVDLANYRSNARHAFKFSRLFFCSQPLQNAIVHEGFNVGHGEFIQPGVSAHAFHGDVKLADSPTKKFLATPKMNNDSGTNTALKALTILRSQGIQCSLTLCGVGDSDYEARIKNVALTEKLPVKFRKLGDPAKELPDIYRAHDAFLYTSEVEEGWVAAPLQAMACGLPAIVSDVLAANDFYRSRHNCLVFAAQDAGLLAGRMQDLIQDDAARCQLAATGQMEVFAIYDEVRMIDRIERYLQRTLEYWEDYRNGAVDEQE